MPRLVLPVPRDGEIVHLGSPSVKKEMNSPGTNLLNILIENTGSDLPTDNILEGRVVQAASLLYGFSSGQINDVGYKRLRTPMFGELFISNPRAIHVMTSGRGNL